MTSCFVASEKMILAMREKKLISRLELYKLVWSKPMTHLAAEYGLSSRGLAKICERHDIPVPPRAYWAKLAAGKGPPVAPLPNPGSETRSEIVLAGMLSDLPPRAANFAKEQKMARHSSSSGSDDHRQPDYITHPAVVPIAEFLRDNGQNSRTPILQIINATSAVDVSKSNVERAIRILNSIAYQVELAGYSFSAAVSGLSVRKGEDTIKFKLRERGRLVPARPLEDGRPPLGKVDTVPSGKLALEITNGVYGLRKRWVDKAHNGIEAQIPDFVSALALNFETVVARREERDEYQERKSEWERRHRLAKARVDRETNRLNYLRHLAAAYEEANSIRRWLGALSSEMSGADAAGLSRVVEWAEARLVQLDHETGVAGTFEVDTDLFPEVDLLYDPLGEPSAQFWNG